MPNAPSRPLRQRPALLAALRREVARLEGLKGGREAAPLPLGLPEIDRTLPSGGLDRGVLHEVAAAGEGDRASAFGFVVVLAARGLGDGPGADPGGSPGEAAAVLVASRRALAGLGTPYGHGLAGFGIDLARLLLVETRTDRDALWALEEALRFAGEGGAGRITVAGAVERPPGLTASRRLSLAAAASGGLLLLLRPPFQGDASAAATRWRIASAPSGRDRFGLASGFRWQVALDRCRNGRPGRWLIEWDHDTHRLRLAEGLADRPLPARAGEGGRIRLAG